MQILISHRGLRPLHRHPSLLPLPPCSPILSAAKQTGGGRDREAGGNFPVDLIASGFIWGQGFSIFRFLVFLCPFLLLLDLWEGFEGSGRGMRGLLEGTCGLQRSKKQRGGRFWVFRGSLGRSGGGDERVEVYKVRYGRGRRRREDLHADFLHKQHIPHGESSSFELFLPLGFHILGDWSWGMRKVSYFQRFALAMERCLAGSINELRFCVVGEIPLLFIFRLSDELKLFVRRHNLEFVLFCVSCFGCSKVVDLCHFRVWPFFFFKSYYRQIVIGKKLNVSEKIKLEILFIRFPASVDQCWKTRNIPS